LGVAVEGNMQAKTVYLETMGCQMNVLDSELVWGLLRAQGYRPTESMTEACRGTRTTGGTASPPAWVWT